ncbi:MAG: Nif3-like dinuclear metal center hexameric protein [Clostridia bacterium]|nr:Nif3-like dinuclear metal center hexameric protein [Clostridia bacterium]
MAKIKDILSLMREFAPESATEPGFDDNVGLIIGSENGETNKVVLCLDCTETVVNEAQSTGAKLIISHHPAIFRGVRKITDEDPTGRMVLASTRSDITVYSAHTNLDFCKGGINDYVADLMGLSNVKPMEMVDGICVGRIGKRNPISLSAFVKELSEKFDDSYVCVTDNGNEKIENVAVVNGGGGDINFINKAIQLGADCYVTADMSHHVRLYASQSGFPVVIMQHYTMEAIYISELAKRLSAMAMERNLCVDFIVSKSERNPVKQEVL